MTVKIKIKTLWKYIFNSVKYSIIYSDNLSYTIFKKPFYNKTFHLVKKYKQIKFWENSKFGASNFNICAGFDLCLI